MMRKMENSTNAASTVNKERWRTAVPCIANNDFDEWPMDYHSNSNCTNVLKRNDEEAESQTTMIISMDWVAARRAQLGYGLDILRLQGIYGF